MGRQFCRISSRIVGFTVLHCAFISRKATHSPPVGRNVPSARWAARSRPSDRKDFLPYKKNYRRPLNSPNAASFPRYSTSLQGKELAASPPPPNTSTTHPVSLDRCVSGWHLLFRQGGTKSGTHSTLLFSSFLFSFLLCRITGEVIGVSVAETPVSASKTGVWGALLKAAGEGFFPAADVWCYEPCSSQPLWDRVAGFLQR